MLFCRRNEPNRGIWIFWWKLLNFWKYTLKLTHLFSSLAATSRLQVVSSSLTLIVYITVLKYNWHLKRLYFNTSIYMCYMRDAILYENALL